MVILVMNMKEKEEEDATVEDAKKNGVNLWWLNGYPSKLRRFNGYTSWD